MQLDFTVMWVDDEINKPGKDIQIVELEEYLENKGFQLHNILVENQEQLTSQLEISQNIDFIFMDKQFNDKPLGTNFILEIRRKNIYADIIYYSSAPVIGDLRLDLSQNDIQGVFAYTKTEISDNPSYVTNIIDYRIQRDLTMNAMRGITMAEVAKFDALIWDILQNQVDEEKAKLAKDIAEKVKAQKKQSLDTVFNRSDNDIWNLIAEKGTMILDSTQRSIALHASLLKGRKSFKKEKNSIALDYPQLLSKRNTLAHTINPNLSDDDLLGIRLELLKFRKIFNTLKDNLCKKQ